MIIERDELEVILEKMISAYAKDRKVVLATTTELKKRNVLDGDVLSIFKLNTPVASLSQSFLYCFTKALHDAVKEHRLDPELYFTRLEIETADKWSQEIVTESDKYPIVFDRAIQIQEGVWLVSVNVKKLNDLFNVRTLIYNPETQRPLIRKEFNDKIIERVDINPKSVNKIAHGISNGTFKPNCITINVLEDGDAHIVYDPKTGKLIIYSGSMNLTDGYHRYRGSVKALLKNPNLDFTFGVILTNYDIEKAKDFIFQEQQHNPINPEHIKALDPDKMSNHVVAKINEKKNSLLRGKITKEPIMLKTNKALVMHNVLADTIDLTFKPMDTKDMLGVSNVMIEGLNTIIEYDHTILNKPVDLKFWVTYVCLIFFAYNVYNGKFVNEVIENGLLKLDMDKIEFKTINKSTIKYINEYLSTIVETERKEDEEDE